MKELQLADDIGSLSLVIHMGKAVKLSKEKATDNFIKSVKYICNFIKSNKLKVFLLLETSCNQGTELFGNIEEFAKMFNSFTADEKKHLKVCLDTAHIYTAGHDLVNETDQFINYIKKNIGVKHIGLIHLNDSKTELGAKVDRHASISHGFIGEAPLIKIAKFAAKNNIDIILETPTSSSSFEDTMKECKKMIKDIEN